MIHKEPFDKNIQKTIKYYSKRIFTLSILLCILTTSCGSSKDKEAPQQPTETKATSENKPDQLIAIENNIEKIFKVLNGPAAHTADEKESKSSTDNKKTDSSGSEKKDTSENGSKKSDTSNSKATEDKASESEKPKEPQDVWAQIVPLITSLHFQWNDYLPVAVKMGANKSLIEGFSNSLNNLTTASETKNALNTISATSSVYGFIPDFYSLYKTKNIYPELKRVKHYIRNAIISSNANNWSQADSDINALNSSWAIAKTSLPKEQQDSINKLDYSIFEFKKVESLKNQQLTDLKGKVAINNIDGIEKAQK